jgi:DNA polymerase-1
MTTGTLPDGSVAANRPVALAICDRHAAVAVPGQPAVAVPRAEIAATVTDLESLRPRWVWWSNDAAASLLTAGIRVTRCWDLSAVHRLMAGGWAGDAGAVWAHAHGLDLDRVPTVRPADLFTPSVTPDEADQPIRADGHLRPEWAAGEWADSAGRVMRWAELALDVMSRQEAALSTLDEQFHPGVPRDPGRVRATALSESAAEMICAELEHDGLPFDRSTGERIVAGFVGPRPLDADDERRRIHALDDTVLRHLPAGADFDLRRPDHVRSLLRRVGIEVPDTRAWRLEGASEPRSAIRGSTTTWAPTIASGGAGPVPTVPPVA